MLGPLPACALTLISAAATCGLHIHGGHAHALLATPGDRPGYPGHAKDTASASLVQSHAALRRLRQSAEAEEVVVVTTPLELLTAISAGAAHLEVRGHMDLTDLLGGGGSGGSAGEARGRADGAAVGDPASGDDGMDGGVDGALTYLLGTLPATLKTVTGNCTDADMPQAMKRMLQERKPTLNRSPRQCMMVTDAPIFDTRAALWISHMYLRMHGSGRGSAVTIIHVSPGEDSSLWVSDCALQYDGVSSSTAVQVEGRAHFLDSQVSHMAQVTSVLSTSGDGSSVAVERVAFIGNSVATAVSGVIQAAYGSAVRVRNCTFTCNDAPYDLIDLTGTSQFFADDTTLRLFYGDAAGEFARIQPLGGEPAGLFLESEGAEELLVEGPSAEEPAATAATGGPVDPGSDAGSAAAPPPVTTIPPATPLFPDISDDQNPSTTPHSVQQAAAPPPAVSIAQLPAPMPGDAQIATDAAQRTAAAPQARDAEEPKGAEQEGEEGEHHKKKKKKKRKNSRQMGPGMQALVILVAISAFITVAVAIAALVIIRRRCRQKSDGADRGIYTSRRGKGPTLQNESSAKICHNLLASEDPSACLSSSTRMSSMQSIGRDTSTGRNASTRTGSMTLPPAHGLAAMMPPSRTRSRSLSSDTELGAALDGSGSAGATAASSATAVPSAAAAPTAIAGMGWLSERRRPLTGWMRDAAELAAAEAAIAATALCGPIYDSSSQMYGAGSERRVKSHHQFTTTTSNAIFEPEPCCSAPCTLKAAQQGSVGSRASWAASPFVPEIDARPAPGYPTHGTAEIGFPRAPRPPPSPGGRTGPPAVSRESVATLVTGGGVGDSSYEVSVRATLPPHADLRARLEFIEYQLDAFAAGAPLLREYVMSGPALGTRFKGGQAVVQMIRQQRTQHEFAMKAFASNVTFAAEAALYTDRSGPLGAFLPQAKAIMDNLDGEFRDPHGHRMPPCIIMEKGESLDMWCHRAEPDRPLVYAVLVHVAKRLADLHAAGYAHRDLKPANVMWLPRENRWTLIDFGCAARIGDRAPLAFTLAYAAPETVRAWRSGATDEVAAAATDAWALGAMAVQLLTREPLFEAGGSLRDAVSDQIAGDSGVLLPWEEGPRADRILGGLGLFRTAILGLLHRDPAQRLTVSTFCYTCRAALDGTALHPRTI
eukprot:jgi/Ulvmu1/12311/UM088_0031.1